MAVSEHGIIAAMPYVFISHLSDDNPRLGSYIHRLLQELDSDIGLWIDTPEEIRADFGSHPRITAIPPASTWNADIQQAVNNSACLLAFWSANFANKAHRNVFISEIDDARLRGRCVQVAIDPLVGWKIPAPFDRDQNLEVARLNEPGGESKFRRVIERIKQLIDTPETRGQRMPVELHLLPYLATRHPQIRPICKAVLEKVSEENAGCNSVRASLFVVPSRIASPPAGGDWP